MINGLFALVCFFIAAMILSGCALIVIHMFYEKTWKLSEGSPLPFEWTFESSDGEAIPLPEVTPTPDYGIQFDEIQRQEFLQDRHRATGLGE